MGQNMTKPSEDESKDFADKMAEILNMGALNLAMAIGYKTGLFDVMDESGVPLPAAIIAEKSGLNIRYITEWLGVMVSGGIVKLSRGAGGDDLFLLPKAHGDVIARRAGNSNLGVYTQEIPLLTACAMGHVLKGFRSGDGVDYDNYPEFQEFMAQLADAKHRQVLIPNFLPSVEQGRLVPQLESGIRVCDLGCAKGVALMLMAAAFPRSEFVGIDISKEALDEARKEADRQGLQNIIFVQMDAAVLKDDGSLKNSFDYVTAFDAIHDQTRPGAALKGVHAILKPGGLFSMVDIAASSDLADNKDHPLGPFLYTVSLMHCMPVGLVGAGSGLGMMWGRQKAVVMLNEAGFSQVEVLAILEDSFNLHYLCQK